VNIYFKQQTPGIGTYDGQKLQKQLPSCNHVFKSGVARNGGMDDKKLEQAQNEPGPTNYNIPVGFDLAERERDKGTSSFKIPLQKKIIPCNLYDPHGEVKPDNSRTVPGPGAYISPGGFQEGKVKYPVKNHENLDEEAFDKFVDEKMLMETLQQRQSHVGGIIYADNNTDRFGQPILPRKPIEIKPGPGQYHREPEDYEFEDSTLNNVPGGYMPVAKNRKMPEEREQGIPGPAYYHGNSEPKKTSFLFNAAEKWVS